ncbi:D-aminoacylase [Ramlibacter sp. RBP-2]|uniref:D-aminoacylase n=1 Tax=Ramlibacter lithotrophicus TaxID=2606681 RepID=A0A7X6I4J1_9BURK|nr:D-aminoacylase [Ramlibacter lithotrophicus]NKE64225.1 D-aminoacylase [Ramlibacter lithotrophicus]
MKTVDLIIRGGTVIDGTKAPRFDADVAIDGGRIVAIGDTAGLQARATMAAEGCIVAPGFIDAHTHDDQAVLSRADMSFKVSQGVTTVVGGNCGISAAPLREGMDLPMPLSLLEAPATGRFTTFAAYLEALRAQPSSVNVAAMVGHTTLRAVTMAALDRPANATEIAAMRALVEEAMQAGAIGMSTGTFYPPATAASTEEIIEVGRPLTARKALYVTHMRDEGDRVLESLDETFRIGRALEIPVVVSHHKLQNTQNFGRSAQTLPFIREAMKHQCIGLDCYPYTAGSTMIRTDRGMLDGRVLIASSEPHPECAGRDLDDIARQWGVAKDEAARRLQPGSAIYFMMDEDDVQRIMAFEETMIGSDGIPVGDKPHPRLWGTFARVLGHYSRDVGLFPLETAVWKMTGLTARNFGLAGRGTLKVGHHADVVVFDATRVRDAANYETPTLPAQGIVSVIVNGAVTWQGGVHTGARHGQVLTRTPQETMT